jgi:hypothetical protein
MSLNVMVLESERGAAAEAERELTAAGHVVLRCHEPGVPDFPCVGLADQSLCPLHSHAVDVALTVRSRVRSQPAAGEDGVRCALMHRVPLVVAGPSALDPYEGFEARFIDRTYDVVGTCEEAAAAELHEYARHAEAMVLSTVGPEIAAGSRVIVHRHAGGLRVSVRGLEAATHHQRQVTVVRIVGALRAYDRSARTIDVEIDEGSADRTP